MIGKNPTYTEKNYKGYHLAWMERGGIWHVYISKRLMQTVGFATEKHAVVWGEKQITKEIERKEHA